MTSRLQYILVGASSFAARDLLNFARESTTATSELVPPTGGQIELL